MVDYDNPWKEILESYLKQFLELCLSDLHAAIDWSVPARVRDKELQRIAPESPVGVRIADKLFEVRLLDGLTAWIMIHVEVQNQREKDFQKRMFVYYYRILERYNKPLVSIAILGDEQPSWRPSEFTQDTFGCGVQYRFPIVKLLDFETKLDELEQSENLFATVILAHLMTVRTARNADNRFAWKLRIMRALYERGVAGDDVRQLFRVIDWLMELPPQLELEFRMEIDKIESEHNMPYITSVERLARIEGREEGRVEGREEGEEKGVLVGQILFAERVLRHRQSDRSELLTRPIAELQQMLSQLTTTIEQNEPR